MGLNTIRELRILNIDDNNGPEQDMISKGLLITGYIIPALIFLYLCDDKSTEQGQPVLRLSLSALEFGLDQLCLRYSYQGRIPENTD